VNQEKNQSHVIAFEFKYSLVIFLLSRFCQWVGVYGPKPTILISDFIIHFENVRRLKVTVPKGSQTSLQKMKLKSGICDTPQKRYRSYSVFLADGSCGAESTVVSTLHRSITNPPKVCYLSIFPHRLILALFDDVTTSIQNRRFDGWFDWFLFVRSLFL